MTKADSRQADKNNKIGVLPEWRLEDLYASIDAPEIEGDLTVGIFQYLYSNPDAIAAAIDDGLLDSDFKTNRVAPGDDRRFFSGYNSVGGSLLYSRGMWRATGEFVVNLPMAADKVIRGLFNRGLAAGFPLGRYFPEMNNCLLVAVTEKRTKADIDFLAHTLEGLL